MRIESVRSLKEELCAGCNVADVGGVATGARHARVPRGVALGVIQTGCRSDWRLAIRLQRRSQQTIAFEARARAMASGEVDAQYVGAVYGPRAFSGGVPELASRVRPLRPGVSIGHHASTAGTLGAFAYNGNGELVIVSNAHVLCAPGYSIGDSILQPGPADGGRAHGDAVVARLSMVAGRGTDGVNYVDAATAVVVSGTRYSLEYGFGALHGVDPDPVSGSVVWKIGRTTGFTRGVIRAVEVDGVEVRYGDKTIVFDNQIEIGGRDRAFSDGGDSGSLILDGAGQAIALLFAGAPAGGGETAVTYANPISAVVQALGVRLT